MFKQFIYYLIHTVACLVLLLTFVKNRIREQHFFLSFRSFFLSFFLYYIGSQFDRRVFDTFYNKLALLTPDIDTIVYSNER